MNLYDPCLTDSVFFNEIDLSAVVKVFVIVFLAIPHCRLLSGYVRCGGNYSFILKLNLCSRSTENTHEICSSFSLLQNPLKF